MKILADENLALLNELFRPLGDVRTKPGRDINATDLHDVDVLLVRSITQVNADLLANANKLKFVGSATIGIDHLDIDYLEQKNIAWGHAPGCNSQAVADYVIGALIQLLDIEFFNTNQSIGIIGYGNVGRAVESRFKALGFQCRVYDPFQSASFLTSFEDALAADIVTLHVPLTTSTNSEFPTWHLIDEEQLRSMSSRQILINSSRGAVISNKALHSLKPESLAQLIFDVWEEEPTISKDSFAKVALGTPHIAGYSIQGKENGSLAIYQNLMSILNLDHKCDIENPGLELEVDIQSLEDVVKLIKQLEPFNEDMLNLKEAVNSSNVSSGFDLLRKQYRLRNEFSYYRLKGSIKKGLEAKLTALGFVLQREGD